jgi:predicted nucleotidyltransferase
VAADADNRYDSRVPKSPLPRRVQEALASFRERLSRRWGADLVALRLFGSRATGTAHAGSDVDVAVVLEQASFRDQCDVIDMATDAGLEHDVLISPTIFDRATYERWRTQQRPLVMDIEHEGVPL